MQYPLVELVHPFGPEYTGNKVRGKIVMMTFELRGAEHESQGTDDTGFDAELLRDLVLESYCLGVGRVRDGHRP